jgi:hypothetical protein
MHFQLVPLYEVLYSLYVVSSCEYNYTFPLIVGP